jgi:predicted protein tyrosine phosphatase
MFFRSNIKIKICDQKTACRILSKKTDFHVVSIRTSFETEPLIFDSFITKYQSIIKPRFDDVDKLFPIEDADLKPPENEDIEKIIRWSEGKNKFLIHCWAGISRSAAIAYLIACSKMPVTNAVKILNPKQHKPNRLILKFGEEILRKNNIIETFELYAENFQNPKRQCVTAGSIFRALKNLFM